MSAGVRALFLGEVVLDVTASGPDPLDMRGHPGGGPLNAAVAAARLGLMASVATGISTDAFGTAIADHLRANDVDLALVEWSDAPTAVAFATEAAGGTRYRFLFEGTADQAFDPRPRPPIPEGTAFVQLNALTSFDDPSRRSNLDLLARAREQGCVVVFDPTVRPLLVPERERWWSVLDAALPFTDLVKASDQDLAFLVPGTGPVEAAARLLEQAQGPWGVIVTLGSDGAALVRRRRATIGVDAVAVEVVDTIGAGDTFSAATMAALTDRGVSTRAGLDDLDDDAWRAVLAFAARAAAVTCGRAGADPPRRAELDGPAVSPERPTG
jgi:fructokinase